MKSIATSIPVNYYLTQANKPNMLLNWITNKYFSSVSWREFALVILVLVYSGNPFPSRIFPMEPQLVLLTLFLGYLLLIRSKILFSPRFVTVASIFATILFAQCIDFAFFPFITMAGFFVRLFIGYALFCLVSNFPRVFVQAMVFLSLLSLVFFIPSALLLLAGFNVLNLAARLSTAFGTIITNPTGYGTSYFPLFLHTFVDEVSPFRNAGMFWEPGAFAGYLILSIIFLSFIKHEIGKSDYRKTLLILSAALLSTMSTTGYIVYPFALLLHYDWRATTMRKSIERGLIAFFIIFPLVIATSMISYKKVNFLKSKILYQLKEVHLRDFGWHRTRFGTLLLDWEYIKRRPLIGWGLHEKTRYSLYPSMEKDMTGMGNGFSDFTAKFGIIGLITWLGALLTGLHRFNQKSKFKQFYTALIIILLLQGEQFLNFPFWLGLAFLKLTHSKQIEYHFYRKPV